MRHRVDDILTERRALGEPRRKAALVVALLGHVALGAAIALAPVFAARGRAEERQYVRVMIVPAKALGVAAPPSRPKARPEPPKREPVETPAPKPRPEPERSRPVVPSVEKPPVRSQDSGDRSAPAGEPSQPDSGESSRRRGGPDGTSLGTSPFGSSEASFDDPDFRYNYYVQQMLAIIGSQWARPRANLGTEVLIHYEIARSGELSAIEVTRSSGNRAFDAAGVRAIALASPLPPLPQSYPHDSLGVTLLIR